jgi:RNA polymerase sigma factor (sigma-70 family)
LEPVPTILTAVIKKAVAGNNEARAWLYGQYSKAMFNICIRMTGDQRCAEDVLQDAFIIAFKELGKLKAAENFGGWLRRIVVNECIRYCKRAVQWKHELLHENHDPAGETGDWWASLDLETVHKAIKQLPGGCRQVFVLYVLEDYTHRDIAQSMGISESTSKSQYQRARQLLKQHINTLMAIHG